MKIFLKQYEYNYEILLTENLGLYGGSEILSVLAFCNVILHKSTHMFTHTRMSYQCMVRNRH